MAKNGLSQCHRCTHNAGVQNGYVKCFFFEKEVYRLNQDECLDQDGSEMPGKVLSKEEFKKEIKFIKLNK